MKEKILTSFQGIRVYLIAASLAVLFAIATRIFLLEAYRIPTTVMSPTLKRGDLIFVNKWIYGPKPPFSSKRLFQGEPPTRGDVVTFKNSKYEGIHFVRRIIGLPGEKITVRDGRVGLNGVLLDFEATQDNCGKEIVSNSIAYGICLNPPLLNQEALNVPEDHFLVLGDSRTFFQGPTNLQIIPKDAVVSKANWVWMSVKLSDQASESGFLPKLRLDRFFRKID